MVTPLIPFVAPVEVSAKDRFVSAYEGDLIRAAYAAGVTIDQGRKWLKDDDVKEQLTTRGVIDPRLYRDIATVDDLKRYWSQMMWNDRIDPRAGLKASELMGKSLGVFIERKEITGAGGGALQLESLNINAEMPQDELEARVKRLKEKRDGITRLAIEEEVMG